MQDELDFYADCSTTFYYLLEEIDKNVMSESFKKNVNSDLDLTIFSLFNVYKATLSKHSISKSQSLWNNFEQLIFSEFQERGLEKDFIDKFIDQRIKKYNKICMDSIGKENPYKELIIALSLFMFADDSNDALYDGVYVVGIDRQMKAMEELMQVHANIDAAIFPYLKDLLKDFVTVEKVAEYKNDLTCHKEKSLTAAEIRIFIYMIIGIVFTIIGFLWKNWMMFISLFWQIPMTVFYFIRVHGGKKIHTAFKIFSIFFINPLSGFALLIHPEI